MIETFFGTGTLSDPRAFFAALVIGLAFGFVLERAGFGSSRKLAGIFYFRDMTVLKVMFTAVITAMLGLSAVLGLGWIAADQVYFMPTVYGAQIVGGLIFGVGFVMSGWCPGTAAVGVASGKLDALVFLGGTVLGAIAFNETYPALGWLVNWGYVEEPSFAFGLPRAAFGLLFALVAVGAFYFAEWVERLAGGEGRYLQSPLLRGLSLTFVVVAAALLIIPPQAAPLAGPVLAAAGGTPVDWSEQAILEAIDRGEDHIESEEVADRLMAGDASLLVVDIRSAEEYAAFHLRGAVHVPLVELFDRLAPYRGLGTIVLYSNGMTHAAQARDALVRRGFNNVYMMTGGLNGFVEWCLTPVSLRTEPLPPQQADRVRAWRAHFLG